MYGVLGSVLRVSGRGKGVCCWLDNDLCVCNLCVGRRTLKVVVIGPSVDINSPVNTILEERIRTRIYIFRIKRH